MRLQQRVVRLEERRSTSARYAYPVHIFEVPGDTTGHTRENCHQCAAMTSEEYEEYTRWQQSLPPGTVTSIEISV